MPCETPQHLYAPPQYGTNGGGWHPSYRLAFDASPDSVTWDLAAILGMIANGYMTGQRTLLQEIKRQPWMSHVEPDGTVRLAEIPPHRYHHLPAEQIAAKFIELVEQEAKHICQGRRQIYILLSGGLDSRIVAGILARLRQADELTGDLIAATWGLPNSRDVVYARKVAQLLDIEWIHIDIGPGDLLDNIQTTAHLLASSISPIDMHRIPWFENAHQEALVLAASYGDSVGRAEYSGSHLLELQGIKLVNSFGLLKPAAARLGTHGVEDDRQTLFSRTPGAPQYVLFEHEMQGQYMRSLIAHAMSLINQYCSIYQMFTHPAVYSYMWGFHPAFRFNQLYVEILRQLSPRLLQLPWARTNHALQGKTVGQEQGLNAKFHNYPGWISGPLYDDLTQMVDPEWFETTGIFQGRAIAALRQGIRQQYRNNAYACHRFVWLASFRRFAELVEANGKQVIVPELTEGSYFPNQEDMAELPRWHSAKTVISNTIKRKLKGIRLAGLRSLSKVKYPVQAGPPATTIKF